MNASRKLVYKALAAVALILFSIPISRAATQDIVFPATDSFLSGDVDSLVFSQDGKLGFALLQKNDLSSARLFSFSPEQNAVVDSFDLASDFGVAQSSHRAAVILIRADSKAATVFAYGNDTAGSQKVLAFTYDSPGHLSRNWTRTYSDAGVFPSGTDLAVTPDGSQVYVLHSDPVGSGGLDHLDLLDVPSGVLLATHDLSSSGIARSIILDEAHNRIVAVSSKSAFVFKRDHDGLDLDARIKFDDPENRVQPSIEALSTDGRFLVTYGGFQPKDRSSGVLGFVTYDLQLLAANESDIPTELFPATNDFVSNRGSGMLLAPLKASFREKFDGAIHVLVQPRRDIGIYQVAADGSVSQFMDVQTPRGNPVGINGRVFLSSSGALGFVPTTAGDLLVFDTLTGEIVDDEAIGTNTLTSVQLLEAKGMLSFTNGTNKLSFIHISTGPAITTAKVRMASTTLIGAKFLVGAHVQINGADIGEVTRDPSDPGHRITINRGKPDFPPGRSFTITVVNRDGTSSNDFVLTR